MKTKKIVTGAVIAALYTALCLALPALSYGTVQVRFSEALTLLPVLLPGGLMGVTLGCFLTNLVGVFLGTNILGALDVLFGTLATLLAAIWTSKLKNRWLAPLPPVVCNAVIVGAEIAYFATLDGAAFWPAYALNAFTVGLGEAIACFVLGTLLLRALDKVPALRRAV